MRLWRDGICEGGRKSDAEGSGEKWLPSGEHSRRDFCKAASALLLTAVANGPFSLADRRESSGRFDAVAIDRTRVLAAAQRYLNEPPITITSSRCNRSRGGKHDYYSESDYFWPDPKNPHGPYIQRDGFSNPSNFPGHRRFLFRFSVQASALAAAWRITAQRAYAEHAAGHLRAWFINKATRMNPNLQFAEALLGSTTGSNYGVIDGIHFVEIVRAAEAIESSGVLSRDEFDEIRCWFADFLSWLTTSPYGIKEMNSSNNHATCWNMQVASYALFTRNAQLADYVRRRLESVIIPEQMRADGAFPLELSRTKPYCYSLLNLEAMCTICWLLSKPGQGQWTFRLSDGRGVGKAVAFMEPYIRDKKRWPLPPDVMYFNDWPMRQCSLLFSGIALERPDYLEFWKTLPADSNVEEVIRLFFIRQPVLWV